MPISCIDFLINYFKNLPVRMPYLVKSLASHMSFQRMAYVEHQTTKVATSQQQPL